MNKLQIRAKIIAEYTFGNTGYSDVEQKALNLFTEQKIETIAETWTIVRKQQQSVRLYKQTKLDHAWIRILSGINEIIETKRKDNEL